MDTITPEMRSKVMSAIHSRDTLPEMRVRKMLWAMASASPPNSRQSIEPLTAAGMAIWATATPRISGSTPRRCSTPERAAGSTSSRMPARLSESTQGRPLYR